MARKKKSSGPAPERSHTLPFLAGLVVVIVAVFWPTLSSDFTYDSQGEILLWDFIHNPANLPTALSFQIMGMDVLDFNRPVAVASFMFDSILWGREPFGYHLTSILLHAGVACLVFLLIRRLLSEIGLRHTPTWRNTIALLATLLFALHPLVTEAVCEPANRKDSLAALFGLAALLIAIRPQSATGRIDIFRLFLIPFLCLLAIGSKEVGIAFPATIFLYWFLFRRSEPVKFWTWAIAASIAVDVIFLIARFKLEHHPSIVFTSPAVYPNGSLGAAMLVQPSILACYAFHIVCPLWLSADYNGYSVSAFPLWVALPLLAILTGLAAWWSIRDKRAFFTGGLVIFSLLPVCNLVPIFHPMADRYLYVPLIGVALLVALALDHPWLAARRQRQLAVDSGVLLVLALLVFLTVQREKVWSNPVLLWQDTLARNPTSMTANLNLPEALLQAGRLEEARRQTESTIRNSTYGTVPWIWFIYTLELNRLGDHAAAQKAARHALDLKPDLADVDKMTRDLLCARPYAEEFAQIAATLPPQTPPK